MADLFALDILQADGAHVRRVGVFVASIHLGAGAVYLSEGVKKAGGARRSHGAIERARCGNLRASTGAAVRRRPPPGRSCKGSGAPSASLRSVACGRRNTGLSETGRGWFHGMAWRFVFWRAGNAGDDPDHADDAAFLNMPGSFNRR